MCMCSVAVAMAAKSYDPEKSRLAKFEFTPGKGLKITAEGEAASEVRPNDRPPVELPLAIAAAR